MPTVLKDASITINGVDVSHSCSHATVSTQRDTIDVSAPLVSDVKETAPGARTDSITITAFQDYANLDSVLWPLYTAGSAFAVVVKPSSAAASNSNPAWAMTGWLPAYSPLDTGVGAAVSFDIPIACADAAGITRGTA